ncbi:hypothetical protein NPIL_92951 [Nephila pilipes]|uniref:Uncharacterized protein n=1 Tax=Nephila pilipes TaxID=299642 RepID=A0A8X6M7F6_NEPPI|nr:hypothetical protein NPIL_92951 [Nephila pilipes]
MHIFEAKTFLKESASKYYNSKYSHWRQKCSRLIPGNNIGFFNIFGDLKETFIFLTSNFKHDIHHFIVILLGRWNEQHKKEKLFCVWLFYDPVVFLVKADSIREFLKERKINDRNWVFDKMKLLLGDGLMTSLLRGLRSVVRISEKFSESEIISDLFGLCQKKVENEPEVGLARCRPKCNVTLRRCKFTTRRGRLSRPKHAALTIGVEDVRREWDRSEPLRGLFYFGIFERFRRAFAGRGDSSPGRSQTTWSSKGALGRRPRTTPAKEWVSGVGRARTTHGRRKIAGALVNTGERPAGKRMEGSAPAETWVDPEWCGEAGVLRRPAGSVRTGGRKDWFYRRRRDQEHLPSARECPGATGRRRERGMGTGGPPGPKTG